MIKAIKYRLNPTDEQYCKIKQYCGAARYIYNWGLNEKSKAYSDNQTKLSCFDLINKVSILKQELPWLSEIPSQALQMPLRNLDNAFTKFFKKQGSYPKFKSKRDNHQSYQYPQGVRIQNNKIFLPKLGYVPFYKDREFDGIIKTVTVSITPANKCFVSIIYENDKMYPISTKIDKLTSVGIDLGIKQFATLSDGKIFENQRYFTKYQRRLRLEQRKLNHRYVKGAETQSKSYQKQRVVVAKIHEKITNSRTDYLHKVSTEIVTTYNTVCIEDLKVSNMVKNHKLAKHIQDCGWRTFRNMLEYKCKEQGKNLIVINQWIPSSKRCNSCGHINKISLSDRIFNCENCKIEILRDDNASKNIRDFGLGIKPLSAKTVH